MKNSRYTISDIAKEAGVSKATVSRAINKPETVESVTLKNIKTIIKKRKFVPSVNARNLSMQSSTTIAVVIPDIDNFFFGTILKTISSELDKRNLIMACFSTADDGKNDKDILRRLQSIGIAGLLYTPADDYKGDEAKEVNSLLHQLNTPIVIMDRETPALKSYDGVFFNDAQAIEKSTDWLLNSGCKTVGLINASDNAILGRIRRSGYKRALSKHNIHYDNKFDFISNYYEEDAYKVASKMLDSKVCPDAVITGNNSITLGLMRALKEHNMINNPTFNFVALDKIDALALLVEDFNYIERDPKLIGENAIRLLIERMAFPTGPAKKIYLNPVLHLNHIKGDKA